MTATLSLVGLGPGTHDLLPPMARAALTHAQALVGYTRYLDLLPAELRTGRILYSSGMRHERERAEEAIRLAQSGIRTALVSSGDPGIYALAGLVIECLEAENALSLPLEIVPGISALLAASALLGAPLGHDFACVSLSDLLTPWTRIETRLRHALLADFVLVLYNPRSRGRPEHITRALSLARTSRPPTTPVGIVKNAFRADQYVVQTPLSSVPIDTIDMLTTVIVGNSESRFVGPYILTPRGYPNAERAQFANSGGEC